MNKKPKTFTEPKLYQSLLTKDGRKTGNGVVVEVSKKYVLCKIRTDYGNEILFNFRDTDIEELFHLGRTNENHKEVAVYSTLLENKLAESIDEKYDNKIERALNLGDIADSFTLSYYQGFLRHNVSEDQEQQDKEKRNNNE